MRKILACLVIGLSLAGTSSLGQAQSGMADPRQRLTLTADDRVLGDIKAPNTIIEYASLSCPHCAHFATEVLPKLKERWIETGKAKLVMRDFPLDEPALRAAMVARCAPTDRYYGLIETFFAQQEQWATARDYRPALEKAAKSAGLTDEEFTACISNRELEERVVRSRLIATQQLGINGTPKFFINGKILVGPPTIEAFDDALSEPGG